MNRPNLYDILDKNDFFKSHKTINESKFLINKNDKIIITPDTIV